MKKAFLSFITIFILFAMLTTTAIAHSGRTDSRGGHKDNKNASGLGSYHYHCSGNPPHLHKDGVCPYKNSGSSTTTPTPTTPSKSTTPQPGDVLGNVLYSDIKAYINGYEISSYNIDGNTMIVAEDLANYGFDVKWNGDDLTLKVEINAEKEVKPLSVEKSADKTGAVRCNYIYTTIKTYVAGAEVKGYNISGKTIIQFDELAVYGKITWDAKTKEIRFTSN